MTCENVECSGDVVSIYINKAYRRHIQFAINDEWQDADEYGPRGLVGKATQAWRDPDELQELFSRDVNFNFCLKCHKIQGLQGITTEEFIARNTLCTGCDYLPEDCECEP